VSSNDDSGDKSKPAQTAIFAETWEADRRLSELRLSRKKLLEVAAIALTERSNATEFHCANAAGTFAYHYGTFALRDKHVQDGWAVDRSDGVESIRHDDLKIKIGFCNVDIACDRNLVPKARSDKGAGIERAAIGNLFGASLPHFAKPAVGWSLFYLMLSEDGASELTRPVVRDGVFVGAVERIFLGYPDDGDGEPKGVVEGGDGGLSNYDPIVTPKTGT
jgi:hypothetical protein